MRKVKSFQVSQQIWVKMKAVLREKEGEMFLLPIGLVGIFRLLKRKHTHIYIYNFVYIIYKCVCVCVLKKCTHNTILWCPPWFPLFLMTSPISSAVW